MRLELIHSEGELHRMERPPRDELPDWRPPSDDPDAAAELLARTTAVLDKLGIEYSLTDGSLLGHLREDGLIPGDGDIDLRVDRAVLSDDLFAALADAGVTTFKKVWFDGELCNAAVHIGDIRLDLSGGQIRGKWMITHAIFREGYLTYRMPWLGREAARFLGVSTWRPTSTEAYVKHCYGDDWQVPAQEWDGLFSHRALVAVTGNSDTLTIGLRRWLRRRDRPALQDERKRRQRRRKRNAAE
ncbi:MAG: LicD family protein [Rhodobacteraceae bacterium]|nr:LicD family protein [Paracoccaceae bacterium]